MGAFDNIKDMTRMKKMADDAKKQMEEIRSTGVSKKGYVKVSLDGEKNLKNIEFSEDALRTNPEELAKCVKEAHKAASKEVEKIAKKQMKNSGLGEMLMGNK